MYKERLGEKEINISHDLSNRSAMQKERTRTPDYDIYSRIILRQRTEKG